MIQTEEEDEWKASSSVRWCFQCHREEFPRGRGKRFDLITELLPGDFNVCGVNTTISLLQNRPERQKIGSRRQIFRCSLHLQASNEESEESRKWPAAEQHMKKSVYPTWAVGVGSRLIWDLTSVTTVNQLQSSGVWVPFANHLCIIGVEQMAPFGLPLTWGSVSELITCY